MDMDVPEYRFCDGHEVNELLGGYAARNTEVLCNSRRSFFPTAKAND